MSDREILQRHHGLLKEELEVTLVLDKLYECSIFSIEDKGECKAKLGRSAQSDELLTILTRKGKRGYNIFMQILSEVQPYLKEELQWRESSRQANSSATGSMVLQLKEQLSNLQMVKQKEIDELKKKLIKLEHSNIKLKDRVRQIEWVQQKEIDELKERLLKREQSKIKRKDRVRQIERFHVQEEGGATGGSETHSDTGFSDAVTSHFLKSATTNNTFVLLCIHLKYDKDRVNLDTVHINTQGDLVNRKSDTRPAGEGRLKKYRGTCSTAPLPRAGCPQYWEVVNRVSLDKPLTGKNLILEVGVCREEQRDVSHCINALPSSRCMLVARCATHGGICRETWKEGKRVLCLPDTLPNTAGASHTLHYGVVYDDARKKIVFIDVKENKVKSTLDKVDSSQPLWPMFGVHNPHLLTVSMTLVVGSDITMTEEKKAMIAKALS
ncbi:uncharacterized protein LOC125377427 isoform X2 [Haliotis rufescens]|uniref:uncharacterized protein LOC125377427 isoform X2 n=1 Tax=Haliotis rufescens TaxID=6454 RepID=UPI00201F9AB5|nr:uncharacterized protein LOC125377427 isoform X2 [Haliotis rufescens]